MHNLVCPLQRYWLMIAWYKAWMEELAKFTSDPYLPEKGTTEAFVSIVADFFEHFEGQKETVDAFAIVNGISSQIDIADFRTGY